MRASLVITATVMLALTAACGGGNGDDVSKEEIADALGGFLTAFWNGEADRASIYWSEMCLEEDILESAAASRLAPQLLGGGLGLTIDPDILTYEATGDEHRVAVSLDQPAGAFITTVDGEPREDTSFVFLGEESIDLVLEDHEWKVASCNLVASEDTIDDQDIGEDPIP